MYIASGRLSGTFAKQYFLRSSSSIGFVYVAWSVYEIQALYGSDTNQSQ